MLQREMRSWTNSPPLESQSCVLHSDMIDSAVIITFGCDSQSSVSRAPRSTVSYCSRLLPMPTQAEANGVAERFGLTSSVEREADGRPLLEADEELSGTFPNITLLLGGSSQGVGTLFVSSRWTPGSHRHCRSPSLAATASSLLVPL